MRVLVTRAKEDAFRTAARLAAAGHEAAIAPVIEIVATGATLPETRVDAILATSVHALFGLDRLPPALAGAPWLVVGQRLADALAARDFGAPEVCTSDVTALLAAIDARYPEPFRFLYLAGRDRKPDLEQGLAQRGHEVFVVEIYDAKAVAGFDEIATTALKEKSVDAVLHFSRRSAALFIERVMDAGLSITAQTPLHIAISSEAAASLQAQGWRVTIARTPDEAAMLQALDEG